MEIVYRVFQKQNKKFSKNKTKRILFEFFKTKNLKNVFEIKQYKKTKK